MNKNITSYQDLLDAKNELKEEIYLQEIEFQNNKFVKFVSSMDRGESLKGSLLETFTPVGFATSPLGSLLNTYLLSNKVIRKYFIGFTILKETIPYAFRKLKEMTSEDENRS